MLRAASKLSSHTGGAPDWHLLSHFRIAVRNIERKPCKPSYRGRTGDGHRNSHVPNAFRDGVAGYGFPVGRGQRQDLTLGLVDQANPVLPTSFGPCGARTVGRRYALCGSVAVMSGGNW
jgi:hypothetical protein